MRKTFNPHFTDAENEAPRGKRYAQVELYENTSEALTSKHYASRLRPCLRYTDSQWAVEWNATNGVFKKLKTILSSIKMPNNGQRLWDRLLDSGIKLEETHSPILQNT